METDIPGKQEPHYHKQLDSLRALAVALVIPNHWCSLKYQRYWFNGGMGVSLFFVLSGFLITGILLDVRQVSPNLIFSLRSFYVRRFLRIVPVYYATLGLAALARVPGVRESFYWNLFYLTNVYMTHKGGGIGYPTHFWSLALEEQFYFFWPWLIMFCPRMALGPLICLSFPLSTLLQILQGRDLYLPTNLALMGLGATFAFLHRREPAPQTKLLSAAKGLAVICSVGFCLAGKDSLLLQPLLTLALGGWIYWAARGIGGWAGAILEWSPLLRLGKISYGLYIFHPFVNWLCDRFFGHLWQAKTTDVLGDGPGFLCMLAVLVVTAELSWRFFEKPINDLKRNYPYVASREAD